MSPRKTSPPMANPGHGPDRLLLWSALLLLALGLVMVASASMAVAQQATGNPFHYLLRQTAYASLGLAAGWLLYRYVNLEVLSRFGPLALIAIGLLLLALLVPGIGREVNGSARWLSLGAVNVQVSELAKLVCVVYIAGYLQRHPQQVTATFWGSLRPLFPIVVLAALVLAEPDLGAAGVMVATSFAVVFLAGMRLLPFLMTLTVLVAGLALALLLAPYRLARLTSFSDPWDDPFGSDFQLVQSLIAIGRGETLGVGLGDSVQKLFYLPEAHTDFIFAVLAEELGLLGVAALLGLFVVLVWRCFRIAVAAEQAGLAFHARVSYGVGIWFSLQALINMGVNMGILPTKGLTLPLVSYGGSSLLVMMVALSIVLRADLELGQGLRSSGSRQGGRGKRGSTGPRTVRPKALPAPGGRRRAA